MMERVSAAIYVLLGVAAFPFAYYLIAIFSTWRYLRQAPQAADAPVLPPVSNLKPIRGLDPGAYQNLASFCRQDYPEYELVLCVDADDDRVASVIERLRSDFPQHQIRVLQGSGRVATNDKVAKLARLVNEAEHEIVVISDSDVRVEPDYLRAVTAPLRDPAVGAVTCFYVPTEIDTFADHLHFAGMMSDFYAGILVAWQLDGVKFALGPTIVTTRTRLAGFGGYAAIENQPADDLLVGRLIAEQGFRVELLPYTIRTVSDYESMSDLLHKRLRWMVVMRHMRPSGHIGLVFTQGLAWCLIAIALHPRLIVAGAYLGTYIVLRSIMTWMIGAGILKQPFPWRQMLLIPLWDAAALGIWIASFSRKSVRWRGADYYIRNGQLIPVASANK